MLICSQLTHVIQRYFVAALVTEQHILVWFLLEAFLIELSDQFDGDDNHPQYIHISTKHHKELVFRAIGFAFKELLIYPVACWNEIKDNYAQEKPNRLDGYANSSEFLQYVIQQLPLVKTLGQNYYDIYCCVPVEQPVDKALISRVRAFAQLLMDFVRTVG